MIPMCKVTIIVPTFQHELYITDCLNSILQQSFDDWEVIIVDDGSKDKTAELVRDYVKKDSRFKYFFQENKGIFRLHELYNFALRQAKGELIAILEGDDYWPSNKLARQVPGFTDAQVGLVWGDGKLDVNGHLFDFVGYSGFCPDNIKNNKPLGSALSSFVFNGNFFKMPTCSVMFRTSALQRVGGFYQPAGLPWLDRSTWALIACVSEFRYIPENLGVWRRHDAQVTQNNTDISSTFDFIFSEKNCPHILADKIKCFKNEYKLLSSYSKWSRSKQPKFLISCLARFLVSPFSVVKFLNRHLTYRNDKK